MKMRKRKLHCFAERSSGVWVAYCLELGLGAQADSFDEAKGKLEAQLSDLSGEEARMLLRQGSPVSLWGRYWFIRLAIRFARFFGREPLRRRRFNEPTPPAFAAC